MMDEGRAGAEQFGSRIVGDLKDRNIVLAVTGGIACYKACTLVSRLAQAGATITVLMTESATRFVAPLTFQSLSGRPVHTSLWQSEDHHDSQHIGTARQAELFIIAPATANTIARIAHGFCDDVVTTVACALPRSTPVLVAPSMNEQMWENPITQENVLKLKRTLGWRIIGPADGWQACRTKGAGRMVEPEEILAQVLEVFGPQGRPA